MKVASRCNLSCDYCYIYQMGDMTWRNQPRFMSPSVIGQTASRIAEHAARHQLAEVTVVLHGGEPLLIGRERLHQIVACLRGRSAPDVRVNVQVQTNGTLLTEDMLTELRGLGIRVGVSLDGSASTHDTHRLTHDRRGTYRLVADGLRRLSSPEHRPMFAGLLCVIDPQADPVETYTALAAHRPPVIDFLLPHANHHRPPPLPEDTTVAGAYGQWLTRAFDHWYGAVDGPVVRLFHDIMAVQLGRQTRSSHIGLSPLGHVVVDVDGSIQLVDSFRSAYDGAALTGLNVTDHDFDDALKHPSVIAQQSGLEALAADCRSCTLVAVCGGGHVAHRYAPDSGFANPSVYCTALALLIRHINRRLAADVSGAAV
ncbi:hypothetical protein GCM10028775_34310 [Catellatospora paridis]